MAVVNSQERTLMVEELSQDQYMKHFDLSYLVSGIYIVMISSNEIILTQKFIKQ
ncbi:MAG TPA: T9SS type A sorting domain-containing protein [Bacteroidales bacterium]|nr:T9SS type A sorting domain-containing protein [Bacteroidales bacterium]